MREKLRSLKTTDAAFWAELCNDGAFNVPKEGETVVEDEENMIEDDSDLIGDDSAIGIAEVVAEVLNLKEGGWVNGETEGLVLLNFAEDGGEAPNYPGPAMNILTSNPGPSTRSEIITTSERSKRKCTANKWYSMKNFIQHDDDGSDVPDSTM